MSSFVLTALPEISHCRTSYHRRAPGETQSLQNGHEWRFSIAIVFCVVAFSVGVWGLGVCVASLCFLGF